MAEKRSDNNATVIARLLAGIEAASIPVDILADHVFFDATVPNWRYTRTGADDVSAELAAWYADPGHFEDLRRTPLADGELVQFTLSWQENGIAHTCHQAHVLQVREGLITKDTTWCGGRWPADLTAQMQHSTS